MKTRNLLIATIVAGGISLIFPSCQPETPTPSDPALMDSIWSDPNDTTDNGGSTNDSTLWNNDSTYYDGGTDSTGGWTDPGDSTWYGGGGTDTTGWGDSTNFGG